jgi:gliding motility-associated lipoprotein GldJ
MKQTNIIFKIFIFISLINLSCINNSQFRSPSTGWKVNDIKGGFYYNTNFKKQETAPGMVFVEGGTFVKGKTQDDIMHENANGVSRQHVQSFYMDETEVTNLMYTEYLYWVKKVFPPENVQYSNVYKGVVPDTLVWRNRLGFNESMTNNYLRHPAYADYPVVGVNWIQAIEYANWRTNRYNESILEVTGFTKTDTRTNDVDSETTFDTETYFASPSSVYAGKQDLTQGGVISKIMIKRKKKKNLYVQRTDGFLSPEYRLPTESEWEYAATSDVGNRLTNNLLGQKKYPWTGSYTRTGKRKIKGDQLANFKQTKGDYGGIAGWSDDGADITNIVKSYSANDFGLYDMAGNVAEWVADVYRPITDDEIADFNYYRGNVYLKNKYNNDGKFEILSAQTMQYDTLSNGKLIARNFTNQIAKIPVDDKETYLRTNFDRSYNVDYRDGDRQSTRFFKGESSTENPKPQSDKERMYNSPINSISKDSLGNLIKSYDKSSKRNTFINDKVRVYKGGSWNDKAYWLDPSQRRYLNQENATSYIGFRCAMSRIGPKSDHPKLKKGYKITRYAPKTKSRI